MYSGRVEEAPSLLVSPFLIFAANSLPMHLSPADVRRLYGSLLFRIPSEEGEKESEAPTAKDRPGVPPAFLKGGAAIDWKLKEHSQLALIIAQSEFKNKELTSLLKQCMLQSGVDLSKVGFGVMPDEAGQLDVTDLPTPVGVLFRSFKGQAGTPVEWADKVLFEGSQLTSLGDEGKRQELILILKQCQQWM